MNDTSENPGGRGHIAPPPVRTCAGRDVITDFEDGVDAIAFLIESFGFRDRETPAADGTHRR